MASYRCMLVLLVIICACEKVACIRPAAAGGVYPQRTAAAATRTSTWKQQDGSQAATWKQQTGELGSGGGAVSATWYEKAHMWKQEIGCSPCEEVYVVRNEGETLQTISEKCHAPFILVDNPHVQDTDDISTGSVLFISSTHLPC